MIEFGFIVLIILLVGLLDRPTGRASAENPFANMRINVIADTPPGKPDSGECPFCHNTIDLDEARRLS